MKKIVIFALITITSSATSYADLGDAWKSLCNGIGKAQQTVENYGPLLHVGKCAALLATDVMAVDSDNPALIKTAAVLSLIATDSKFLYELLRDREHARALAIMLYDIPVKFGGSIAATAYDIMRYRKAEEIAAKNQQSNEPSRMRGYKIIQSTLLFVEACLRLLTYASAHAENKDPVTFFGKNLSCYTSEIADFVEIFRLLNRFGTLVSFPEVKTTVNVGVQKGNNEGDANKVSFDVQLQASTLVDEQANAPANNPAPAA